MKELLKSPVFYFPMMMMSGRYSFNRLFENVINIPLQFTIMFLLWILFLLSINKNNNFSYNVSFLLKKSNISLVMYIFLIVSLFSIFYTPNINLGLNKMFEIFIIVIMCFITILIFQKEKDFYILAVSYTLNSAFLFIVAIPQLITFNSERIAVLGGGPNVFGRLMFFGLISSLYIISCNLIINPKKIKTTYTNYLLLLGTIMFVLGIVISGSRSVYIGTIISLLVFSFYFISKETNVIKIIKIISLIAFFFSFFAFTFKDKLIFFYNYRMKYLFSDLDGGTSVLARQIMKSEAREFFLENPIIGLGISGFKELSIYKIYPHNIFYEFLSELGIMGGIIFIVLVMYSLLLMRKNQLEKNNDYKSLSLPLLSSMFVFIFISSQFSGDFFDNRLFFVGIVLLEIRKKFKFKQNQALGSG